MPEETPRPPHRRTIRWVLFALLPLALIGGAYRYVTGGQVISMDDAYIDAETVGISTDVSQRSLIIICAARVLCRSIWPSPGQ